MLNGIEWRRPRVVDSVDRRSVANPTQARKLLGAVEQHSEYGRHLVPLFPELVTILRRQLEEYGTAPDGRIFQGQRGVSPMVSKSTYAKVWREARVAAFGVRLAATPLARRPYDLRHACVSTWLNAGVPATQVAEWAGHSVDVLLRIYAKCLDGTQDAARRRIKTAMGDTVEPGEVRRSDAAPDDEHQPDDDAPTSEEGEPTA
jgi:hypothetical protein